LFKKPKQITPTDLEFGDFGAPQKSLKIINSGKNGLNQFD
jgi:hypothetical protein